MCYPSTLTCEHVEFKYSEDSVVVSGNLITSRGPGMSSSFYLLIPYACFGQSSTPIRSDFDIDFLLTGTAFPFALTIVELLCGKEKREQVRGPMVFPANTPF